MADQYLLRKGDIIRLEKEMRVCTAIAEKFLRCCNAPFSDKKIEVVINIGEVRHKLLPYNKENLSMRITEKIKEVISSNLVTKEKVSNFINSLGLDFSPEEFDTSVYAGEYRVYKTRLIKQDFGPDIWQVYCKKISPPLLYVHFCQTGISSYPTICDIKPIRHED